MPAPIPDQLAAKLQQTADDAQALAVARFELTAKQAAEQVAVQARQGSEAAVASDLATLQGDKQELHRLVDASFPEQPVTALAGP